MSHEKEVFLSAQRDAKLDRPARMTFFTPGPWNGAALLRAADGTVKALIEGNRGRRCGLCFQSGLFMVVVQRIEDDYEMDDQNRCLDAGPQRELRRIRQAEREDGERPGAHPGAIDDLCVLGDTMAAHLIMKVKDKQEVLETETYLEAGDPLRQGRNEINILSWRLRLKKRVKKQMERPEGLLFE